VHELEPKLIIHSSVLTRTVFKIALLPRSHSLAHRVHNASLNEKKGNEKNASLEENIRLWFRQQCLTL